MSAKIILLPNFFTQMNSFVVGGQMIVAPEALATFLTLMRFLTWIKQTRSVGRKAGLPHSKRGLRGLVPYQSGSSDVWSGDRGV